MMSDPKDDPKGWLATLDRIEGLHASLLVPTRGDATRQPEAEIAQTRKYIQRVLEVLAELRKQKMPEARVAAELVRRKIGDYCPVQLDNINVLSLYRRASADGTVIAPAAAPPRKKAK
jgi:hypothetical protein